ncbi:coiled-coil domain-containing protein 169-like [Lingula anatina]|uniref:Coiled-coil domain-containing protein 169-like n=1 Tax=Lingula anatina TaxID=7574 RepID=A0A1S3IXN2_LINAN|nr:coiled-coil domain-containing protein 169-like [Lingula anatina]|eukprot:XP_013402962.1 coiled-coil domain-containing protein 169-like [Lingula anatina]
MKCELAHEREMKKLLQQSRDDWKLTVAELKKRYDNAMHDDYEWKIRYETQVDINKQFERQIQQLAEKLRNQKTNIKNKTDLDNMAETDLKRMISQLTREKGNLDSQLKDFEWRLDQEAKAFIRADEKRKMILLDISQAKNVIKETERQCDARLFNMRKKHYKRLRERFKVTLPPLDRESNKRVVVAEGGYAKQAKMKSEKKKPKNSSRMLNPKMGPAKKTALVNKLPPIQDDMPKVSGPSVIEVSFSRHRATDVRNE